MGKNVREEEFEHIELFGKPALFSNHRIDRDTVPEGFYLYDLRGSGCGLGRPITMENRVADHAGAVLTAEPVKFQKRKRLPKNQRKDKLSWRAAQPCTVL